MNTKICLLVFATLVFASSAIGQLDKKSEKAFKEKYFMAENFLLAENYTKALNIYFELKSMDPENANIKWKIGTCFLNSSGKKTSAIPFLESAASNISPDYAYDSPLEKYAPVQALRDLAQAYHLNYQLDTAIAVYNTFLSFVNEKETVEIKEINRQISICSNAQEYINDPVKAIITNLGAGINGTEADHSPVVTADESMLMFTSRRPDRNPNLLDENSRPYEDIYVSYKNNMDWTQAEPLDTNINTDGHEATIGLSADGQTLFIYKDDGGDGNIYKSELTGESWSKPQLLGSDINSPSWETNAVISADGGILYFVSDRAGGFGGRDIYRCMKFPNGEWSLAQNLGPAINTEYDEDAPFIHPDGIQLFFSSNGHKSMGGFDVFSSELTEEGKWTIPENIRYPINTTDDDIFYITSTDGKRSYYSSIKADGFGNQDIFMISLPEAEEKNLTILKGVLADQFGNVPGFAEIIVTDNETGQVYGVYNPNSTTGNYLLILKQGKNYNISYEAEGHLFHSENIFIAEKSAYSEIEKPIELSMIRVGGIVVLNNLFFKYNEKVIIKESEVELERLYNLMNSQPGLIVEIAGHTDSKGNPEYNLTLSQSRAQEVVDAIVKKGISKDRLIAKGYGETMPVANNLDNDGKEDPVSMAKNRRVELKVLELNKK